MMHPYEKKVSMFDTKTKTMNRGINLCSKHKILVHGPTTKIGNKTCYTPKVLNIFSLHLFWSVNYIHMPKMTNSSLLT